MNICFRCETCEKQYTRKSSFDKHRILCDYLIKSKREKQIINEESADLPSYSQLIGIVQELSLKYSQLENQMLDMKKWVEKKKKKINVITWLNNNIHPSKIWDDWLTAILITESHFEFLLNNSITDTIHQIMEENISTNTYQYQEIIPVKCFSQKSNLFYICKDITSSGHSIWQPMTFEDFIKILKHIQNRLLITLTNWKIKNKDQINNNDSMSILYNKTIIKLMNISFSKDSTSGKIRANLYNYLKSDLKNLIEYDFEF